MLVAAWYAGNGCLQSRAHGLPKRGIILICAGLSSVAASLALPQVPVLLSFGHGATPRRACLHRKAPASLAAGPALGLSPVLRCSDLSTSAAKALPPNKSLVQGLGLQRPEDPLNSSRCANTAFTRSAGCCSLLMGCHVVWARLRLRGTSCTELCTELKAKASECPELLGAFALLLPTGFALPLGFPVASGLKPGSANPVRRYIAEAISAVATSVVPATARTNMRRRR